MKLQYPKIHDSNIFFYTERLNSTFLVLYQYNILCSPSFMD